MHTFTYVYVLEKQVESTPKTKWADKQYENWNVFL